MRKEYRNQRKMGEFEDGITYHFRSKFEYNWAQYLEFLKRCQIISKWKYEPETFYFLDEITAPVQYTPDFKIYTFDAKGEKECVLYQETKGHHDGQTNTKFRRMAKHHPDVIVELVLQSIPKNPNTKSGKQSISRRRIASKYVRRIIDASEIFRQVKGVIKLV